MVKLSQLRENQQVTARTLLDVCWSVCDVTRRYIANETLKQVSWSFPPSRAAPKTALEWVNLT